MNRDEIEVAVKAVEGLIAQLISLQVRRSSPYLRIAVGKLSSALEALRDAEVEE